MTSEQKTAFKNWQKGLDKMNLLVMNHNRTSSFSGFIDSIEDNFNYALTHSPKSTHSGLIDMQAIFLKSKK